MKKQVLSGALKIIAFIIIEYFFEHFFPGNQLLKIIIRFFINFLIDKAIKNLKF